LIGFTNTVCRAARFSTQQVTEATILSLTTASEKYRWGALGELVPGLEKTRRIISSDVVPKADSVLGLAVTLSDADLIDIVRRNMTAETFNQDAAVLAVLTKKEQSEGEEGVAPSIRRHRPGSLMRKFHEEVRDMALPTEEWLVASGLDLFQMRTHLKQLQRTLFGLSRSAKVQPRTPIKSHTGKSFARFSFAVGRDEIVVVPELYSKLALYAAFRERDHALLMTLKGHAITWLKEHDVTYLDGYPAALWSSVLAWIPGELDEAVMRVTESPRVKEKIVSSYDWVRDGVSRHVLGLSSWWDPRYQLDLWMGNDSRAAIPKA
jgi:hypothetical protein